MTQLISGTSALPRARRRTPVLAALLAIMLAAGAAGADERRRIAGAIGGAASSPDAAALPALEAFPSLGRAMALARERGPDVVRARGSVGVAQASYAGARLSALDNPYLEVFVDRGLQGVTKDAAVQANLWLPLEVSGQRARRIDEADALVAWQKTLFEVTRFSAEGDAVRAYGAALVAGARVRTLEGIVRDAGAEAEVYRQRREAGDATLQEEKLASMEHARYLVMLQESRADLTRALVDLARATGRMFEPPDSTSAMPPVPGEMYGEAGAARLADTSPHVAASTREASFYARAGQRAAIEAHPPVNLIVTAGRGDLGEPRFGGGLSWTFPVARRKQAEVARADAERARALAEAEVKRRLVVQGLSGLELERAEVRRAREVIDTAALPAAQASADAAIATKAAGKGEMLLVLTTRRDLELLRLRRLELIAREWSILGDIVAWTGELP
ncbi:TolC family protein [Polyangium fumosum]|uniref:TolC family protein n=1 Tax=Polyangium fumosum TaxID=889272 RepID=A0A4U1IW43_9BACT|nr:TolC family protein [Polyangium fumosum]TKC98705.1 hypothetical protein E8A74_40080 [Polyangium fumosum]